MKIAFIKTFLNPKQVYTHSVTFDYLIASLLRSPLGGIIETKICFSPGEVIDYKPDIVCCSTATEAFMRMQEFAVMIKKEVDCVMLLGGTHITAVPQTLPDIFDIAVIGEAEQTIVDLLTCIHNKTSYKEIPGLAYKENGELKITEKRKYMKMDDLPIPVYKDIKYEKSGAVPILTTRGCVNICSHCSEQRIWRPFRVLSSEKLVDVMETHYKQSGKTSFLYLDDISFYNLKRVQSIRDILKERGLLGKLRVTKGAINSELVTEPIVVILKELGLKLIGFGLESACPEILEKYKMGRVKVSDFVNCMKLLGKYKIRNGASTVWGYPGETLDNMKETRDFLYEWNGKNSFYTFEQYVCQPLPGSDLWDMLFEQGKLSYDMDFSKIQIKPDYTKDDWFYANEDNVPRETFVKFIQEVSKELKKIRKETKGKANG